MSFPPGVRGMNRWLLTVLVCQLVRTSWAAEPIQQWRLDPDHVRGQTIKATVGGLDARILGPARLENGSPRALVVDGNSRARHCVEITSDIGKASLPRKAISIEAWVRIDKTQEWGGIAGAFQHNGPYQKGWLLGYQQNQFFFAVAGERRKQLTYLKARTRFQTDFWYHVVGTYDGTVQNLYVDGQISATSTVQQGDIDYPSRAFYTLGAYRDEDEHYTMNGRLALVSVFDKALDMPQVSKLYRDSRRHYPDTEIHRPTIADWPTYLRDNTRTGISPEELKLPLQLQWVHRAGHLPKPAWPEEAKNDYYHDKYNLAERVVFDRVFHPVGVDDRVYFASSADDHVYCLDADTGHVRWRFATEGPVRLAPTIVEDRLLFGSDDGFVYCLNARDGTLLWKRELVPGAQRIPGNERIISPWPVRTDLLVEEGRAHVCAGVFPSQGVYQFTLDVRDGTVLDKQTLGVTAQGYLERTSGKLLVATGRNLAGAFVSQLKRHGKDIDREVSTLPADYPYSFVGAGGARIGGGDGKLAMFSVQDGKKLWSAQVEGKVHSLAVVRGRLLASTDKGAIYCFGSEQKPVPAFAQPLPESTTAPVFPGDGATSSQYERLADDILKRARIRRGYCLVIGSKYGELAYRLAQRSEWQIIGLEADSELAENSRRRLHASGLSGRITIHHGPLDKLLYGDMIFNVIVGEALAAGGTLPTPRAEVERVLRPEGGVAFFGLKDADIVRRGPLPGAGEWTHLYGDAGNSACSRDELVKGELQVQWFGPPGARPMVDRHHRTTSPLYKNGRLFVPGDDRVIGVDAYNGTILWDRAIPQSRRVSVFRDNGYLAVADDALYVAAGNRCLALDPDTGGDRRIFALPPEAGSMKFEWGYVAAQGDLLLGSAVKAGSIRREQSHKATVTTTHWDFVPAVCSNLVFAHQRREGTLLWTYRPQSGLIVNPTLAAAGGVLYFVESSNPWTLMLDSAQVRLAELVGKGSSLVALDIQTGQVRWRQSGAAFTPVEHNLFLSWAEGALIIVGSRNSGPNKKTDRLWYDIHVFDGRTGKPRWSKSQNQEVEINGEHGEQERHPVIVNGRLYCEPYAYDLATGARVEWNWPWNPKQRRGCGTLSASASCFFFRDENVAAFDLGTKEVKKLTSETRPGCWINLLPAGGLLLAPEASSGCSCDHPVQTSLALRPKR